MKTNTILFIAIIFGVTIGVSLSNSERKDYSGETVLFKGDTLMVMNSIEDQHTLSNGDVVGTNFLNENIIPKLVFIFGLDRNIKVKKFGKEEYLPVQYISDTLKIEEISVKEYSNSVDIGNEVYGRVGEENNMLVIRELASNEDDLSNPLTEVITILFGIVVILFSLTTSLRLMKGVEFKEAINPFKSSY